MALSLLIDVSAPFVIRMAGLTGVRGREKEIAVKFTYWILTVVVFAFNTPALAGGMKVSPGKWEFRSSAQQPMGGGSKTEVTTQSVSNSEMTPERFMRDAKGCTVTDTETTGAMMRWKMSCAGTGGQSTGDAEFTSTGTAIRGAMNMMMQFGGQQMTFARTWEGKHVGPCH